MSTPRLRRLTSLLFAPFLLGLANAADAPVTYTINLAPAMQVGTKFSLITDATDESQTHIAMTMPGTPAPQKQEQDQQIIAHLEGEAEVLGVFPNNSIQKLAVTVKTFIATSESQALPGLPVAGDKIVAEKNGANKVYTVNGQPASANVAKLLDEVIEMGDEKYTDQDVFGPTSPVAVNATWPVNPTALIAGLKTSNDIEVSGAKGTMKLDAVKGHGADQVATVTGLFTVEGAKPPLPPGMTVDSMIMSGGLAGTVPATAKGMEKETMTASMQMAAHGSGSSIEIKIDSTGKQKKTSEKTFH